MPDDVRVHIDSAEVQKYLRADNGPVVRHLMVVAERVRARTRSSLKDGFPKSFLGPTIVKRVITEGDETFVAVGSNKVVTRPHPIDAPEPSPGRPNPHLRFPSTRMGGGYWYGKHVDHPGSDFTKYLQQKLSDALEAMEGESDK